MSEKGVFAVDRGVWDHDAFEEAPFTQREAWMWLVGEAAFRERTRNIGGRVIELKRGQLAASIRFLAERWGWSKSKVERFLDRLKAGQSARGGRPRNNPEKLPSKNGTMIETDSGTGVLVITVCNYDNYQRVSLPIGTPIGTDVGTTAGQQRDKRENIKNIKEESCAVAKATRTIYDAKFEEAWQAYPRRDGGNPKQPSAKLFLAAVKAGENPQAIIDGVKRYAIAESRNVGTPYIPQMVKWLRDKRWLDYGQVVPGATVVNIRSNIV